MIIDLSMSNFRSFQKDQMLSMNVEGAHTRHSSNYTLIEDGRIGVLRSAAILGANASGKSNLLTALMAVRWIVQSSSGRKEGQSIPPYEPFRLSEAGQSQPVRLEIEFVVPSGVRYRYELAFSNNRILEERLYSFARRVRATIFERSPDDTWETVKFGGTFKGGSRRFPFFPNAAYLSRAGNDASAPEFIREIYRYFGDISHVPAGNNFFSLLPLTNASTLAAVSELICLADTGVNNVTMEEKEGTDDIKLPDDMPESVKDIILSQNRLSARYWIRSQSGELVAFDSDEMSDGTTRLLYILPLVLEAFEKGAVLAFDEIDAHFHTDIVDLILRLFHDNEINIRGAQIIFTTHDTNILDSTSLRRDQIWFVTKDEGSSTLKSLDEYDRKYVRHDSPFETFYRDGRLGALPRVSYGKVKEAILGALAAKTAFRKDVTDA
ncbi:ATP-binding protein [Sphingomonas sp. PvP056]|uniref:AAA family ATPase n=1 Tax=Sphingomonas sp. PvP056 TaxID=3156392 RepID=UPI003392C977